MSPTCHGNNTITICWRVNFSESVVSHNWLSAKYTETAFLKVWQTDGRADGRTESDAYEPTMQYAQVG